MYVHNIHICMFINAGQRAERRKWIRVFKDNIDLIMYVMSLSSYDQVLFEDNTTRCYDETFKVFEEISQNPIFMYTDFAVFFNKVDIFDVKIAIFKESTQTMVNNANPKDLKDDDAEFKRPQRDIFFHVTCATDTRQMQQVINDVQFGIVRRQLETAELA
ncbi:hypothetical protein RFI_19076 [Reticulomyxa filosa]|uniref:Uncharacterized protein n=1 Tax=Reticulomyxa filosa TaxID=46433 RepID=X6MWI4_RETFI|nr:hypothetical protein RFI_19076 [Reticulomyxa filosa]|eukprot:ETO18204.1 hypothetical protein RFI_19076 [Reticulomyxa filosa]